MIKDSVMIDDDLDDKYMWWEQIYQIAGEATPL
jgi:hypothetical protein